MTVVLRLARDTLILPVLPVVFGAALARLARSAAARRAWAAVAVAAGIAVAHLVDVGVPRLPPVDTIGWIPAAVVLAPLAILAERRRAAGLLLALVLGTAAAWLVGRPVWAHAPGAGAAWALAAGAATAAVAGSLEAASQRVPRAATLLALAMTMAGASITCLVSRSALLAQVIGASAAVLGAAGLAALFIEPGPATAVVAAVAGVAVVLYARLYAALPAAALALLGASAVAPLLASWLPLGRRRRAVASFVLAMGLAAAAILAV